MHVKQTSVAEVKKCMKICGLNSYKCMLNIGTHMTAACFADVDIYLPKMLQHFWYRHMFYFENVLFTPNEISAQRQFLLFCT